jgi:hypothetical protein
MPQHIEQVDTEFAQFLHALPAQWEQMMRQMGAFTYGGKIASPKELLRAIFLYCGPDQSLREVAGTLTLQAQRITDQAVWKRLNRCTSFLRALFKHLLGLDDLPPIPNGLRFIAYDGTTLECPGATGTDYRLHLGIDLATLRFHEIHVSDTTMGESLKHYHLQPGDVALVDQGYCSHSGIFDVVYDKGADVIVRWNHHRSLYHADDRRRALDFAAVFKSQKPGTLASQSVVLKYTQSKKHPLQDSRELLGYLYAYRLTQAEAKVAQKRVSRKHQKKQKKLTEKTLLLCQFVFVFTSLSPAQADMETILALYRCRWQIELAIKRLKSLIHLDTLRAKQGSQLAEVYLYGKVLYVWLIEREMRATFGEDWGQLDRERQGTPWRLYKLLKARVDAVVLAQWLWKAHAVTACLHVMMERPRKRKLQSLPRRIVNVGLLLDHLPTAA